MKKDFGIGLIVIMFLLLGFSSYMAGYHNGKAEGEKIGLIKGMVEGHTDVITDLTFRYLMCPSGSDYCRSIYDSSESLREKYQDERNTIYPKE